MKTLREIEELTNKTISSIDDMQPAQVNPYLYAKIMNRVQARHQVVLQRGMKLMFGFTAVLLLLLFMNIVNIQLLKKQDKNAKQAGISAFYQAYFPQENGYSY